MKIDIYKSTKNDDKYLSVPEGTDIAQLNLPEDTDPDLLDVYLFKAEITLDLSQPRMGLNQEDIQNQITEKGYAIHGASVDVSIGLTGMI